MVEAKTDLRQQATDMRAWGLTLLETANLLGVSVSTARRWAIGGLPSPEYPKLVTRIYKDGTREIVRAA